MCLLQFMEAYGWQIVLSILSGLATGALTSYAVTHYFRRKDERDSITQTAKDLARECHVLLDLTNKLIDQIALRKYHAYHIIHSLIDLDGETKRRTRNEETMKVGLTEVSKETLERLCVSIHTKKINEKIRARHGTSLGSVLTSVDACIEAAGRLCLSFGEITDFHYYVCNVEHMSNMAYEDFIEKLEQDEVEQYKGIPEGRDKLKKRLYDLVTAIGAVL